MNLISIRNLFRSLSGRYDLIDDDPDRVIDHLINAACRTLDRLTEHQRTFGSHFAQLTTGLYHIQIPYCRSIKEVWISSTTERWQLEKMDLQDLIVDYLSSAPTNGTPLHYSPVITRKIPADVDLSAFSTYMTFLDTLAISDDNYNAIAILPPPDQTLLIEVRGFYYSKELVLDTDENYWTSVHPMTLLKAAMRELEVFNLNRSKIEIWDKALSTELDSISKDLVQEIVSEIDELEG